MKDKSKGKAKRKGKKKNDGEKKKQKKKSKAKAKGSKKKGKKNKDLRMAAMPKIIVKRGGSRLPAIPSNRCDTDESSASPSEDPSRKRARPTRSRYFFFFPPCCVNIFLCRALPI